MLTAFLELSKGGVRPGLEEVAEEALVSREVAREALRDLYGVELARARLMAVLRALELGVEPEKVARHLNWKEFEELAAEAFGRAGYEVARNVRFTAEGRRHQVDLMARRDGTILVIDCKHWAKPPTPSEEEAIAGAQERRLRGLKSLLSKLSIETERAEALLIPLVLTLYQPSKMEFRGHLFVPVSRLRGLLEYLESAYFTLRHEKALIPRGMSLQELLELLPRKS